MSAEANAGTVVVGVGNAALSDEGVAGRVVREVARRAPPWVEVLDAGLPGPGILRFLEGRKKAVIVDAIDAGQPPGMVCRFRLDDVRPAAVGSFLSLHQGDLLQYLWLAEILGMSPPEMVVIGVQAQRLSPGEKLSAPVEKAVPEAAELVLAEVRLQAALPPEQAVAAGTAPVGTVQDVSLDSSDGF